MAKLDAAGVAKLLVELGRRTALAGDNYFRARAYLRAAERIAALTEPLSNLVEEKRLRELSGVGDVIADVITELHRTGTHPLLDRLRQDVPESVLDMLTIPGLKPDKIDILHRQLGITTLAELETAAKEDRLKGVKGLGPLAAENSARPRNPRQNDRRQASAPRRGSGRCRHRKLGALRAWLCPDSAGR